MPVCIAQRAAVEEEIRCRRTCRFEDRTRFKQAARIQVDRARSTAARGIAIAQRADGEGTAAQIQGAAAGPAAVNDKKRCRACGVFDVSAAGHRQRTDAAARAHAVFADALAIKRAAGDLHRTRAARSDEQRATARCAAIGGVGRRSFGGGVDQRVSAVLHADATVRRRIERRNQSAGPVGRRLKIGIRRAVPGIDGLGNGSVAGERDQQTTTCANGRSAQPQQWAASVHDDSER